jgi:hypothetical protein
MFRIGSEFIMKLSLKNDTFAISYNRPRTYQLQLLCPLLHAIVHVFTHLLNVLVHEQTNKLCCPESASDYTD